MRRACHGRNLIWLIKSVAHSQQERAYVLSCTWNLTGVLAALAGMGHRLLHAGLRNPIAMHYAQELVAQSLREILTTPEGSRCPESELLQMSTRIA